MAAVLTNGKGFYTPLVYVLERYRLGLKFLPRSVNGPMERGWRCHARQMLITRVEQNGLHFLTLTAICLKADGQWLKLRCHVQPAEIARSVS